MKKVSAVVFLFVVCVAEAFCSFSKKHAIQLSFNLNGFQAVTSSLENRDTTPSQFSFGAEAVYKKQMIHELYFQMGVNGDTSFNIDEKNPVSHILVFAGFGFRDEITENFVTDFQLVVGNDTFIHDETSSDCFAFAVLLDFSHNLVDNLSFSAGFDAKFDVIQQDGEKYIDYRILPVVGLSFIF